MTFLLIVIITHRMGFGFTISTPLAFRSNHSNRFQTITRSCVCVRARALSCMCDGNSLCVEMATAVASRGSTLPFFMASLMMMLCDGCLQRFARCILKQAHTEKSQLHLTSIHGSHVEERTRAPSNKPTSQRV